MWNQWLLLGLMGCGATSSADHHTVDWRAICSCPIPGPSETYLTDRFVVPPPAAVDVLLVVDNDLSMADAQSALSLQAWALLDPLMFPGSETHIGVISTDMDDPTQQGRLQGDWIDAADATAFDDLALAVQLGTDGSATSRPYDAAYAAISGDAASDNPGFYRPSANLLVIVLSDDVDQSDLSVDDFNDWLWHLKDPGIQADFLDLADSDIEEWGAVLSRNIWQSLGMGRWYHLTQMPTPGTVQVRVIDGGITYAFEPPDWQFDDRRVGVHFAEFVPTPGSEVYIQYDGLWRHMAR